LATREKFGIRPRAMSLAGDGVIHTVEPEHDDAKS
jgi:hypothetical protein